MQQLSGHFPPQYCWQGIRPCHPVAPADSSLPHLPRVPVWLQSQPVNCRHDLLITPAAGECREQQMPLYIAFIDLTKAFDLVSRSGLFRLLQKIGCPPQLLAVVTSFHVNMRSTVCFNGATSESFLVSSGVKQGCVLAPTLFGIFFSMLLQYAFKDCHEGVYIHTRTGGKLFNIARLRAKTKVTEVLIHEMLFADDAALTSHTEDGLQQLVSRFSYACKEFGQKSAWKKTTSWPKKKAPLQPSPLMGTGSGMHQA